MKYSVVSASLLLSLSVSSCMSPNYADMSRTPVSGYNSMYVVEGTVEFPLLTEIKNQTAKNKTVNNFSTKATIADIAAGSTITLLYPPDYENEALRNRAIATGLTNNSGNFMINPSVDFAPSKDDIFVIEAIKRKGGPGNKVMALRTYLKWTGSSWESITTPGIYINTKTTAVSVIAGLRPDKVTSSALIGKFPIVNNSTQVNSINEFSSSEIINGVVALVLEGLDDEQDTVGVIRFDPKTDKYYREKPAPQEMLYPLAFTTNRGGATNIFSMFSNGSEQKQLTSNADDAIDFYDPVFSPDKSRIAFVTDDFSKSNIWIIDSSGYNLSQLTSDSNFNSKPVWSPDGTMISYNSDKDGGKLVIADIASGTKTESSVSNADFSWSSWSPDSQKVLFTSGNEIYVMNKDGSGLTKLTDNENSDHSPVWSPDGTRIAFISERSGNDDIFIMDSNGSNQVNITSSPGNEAKIRWSPDSSKLTFQYDADNQLDVYTINADGNERINISNNPADDYLPFWLNNHDLLFVSERDSNREIYKSSGDVLTNISNNVNNDSLNSAYPGMD